MVSKNILFEESQFIKNQILQVNFLSRKENVGFNARRNVTKERIEGSLKVTFFSKTLTMKK
jgi:hypothetical protein